MSSAIILCADDFAQNCDISEGILLLAKNQRINAISCLVNSPAWPEMQQELGTVKTRNYLGLHFNLTLGKPLSSQWREHYGARFGSMRSLLKACYLGQMNQAVVDAEIRAQLDAFSETMGCGPDFIDGHQHVHQLPVIRDAWLAWYAGQSSAVFFRNTSNGLADKFSPTGFPKRQLISLLGGLRFRRHLASQSIPANGVFAGIYHFSKAKQYRNYFRRFLATMQHNGLIMCHPGLESSDQNDPLSQYRFHELNYFMSEAFLTDLAEANCQLRIKV